MKSLIENMLCLEEEKRPKIDEVLENDLFDELRNFNYNCIIPKDKIDYSKANFKKKKNKQKFLLK